VLIGGGMVSSTLGVFLKKLNPTWKIQLYEALGSPGEESSNGWHNAGTGHSALCEPNYTPQNKDGSVDISKTLWVAPSFCETREFLAHLVENKMLPDPNTFINSTPHMTFVMGEEDVAFLKERWTKMKQYPLFKNMEYTEDPKKIREWAPLLMNGRDPKEKVAATRAVEGTDIDFGALTKGLVKAFNDLHGEVYLRHKVQWCKKQKDGTWLLKIQKADLWHEYKLVKAKFVCVGAGGNALNILRGAGIPEVKGYGAFPISGLALVCSKPEICKQHHAKVYAQAECGAPPMSVPHLDTRVINGQNYTLFAPFAGFSPRFLKTGSLLDFPCSIRPGALPTMVVAGLKNFGLTIFLAKELMASKSAQLKALRRFYPDADPKDWSMVVQGQRVCIMRPTKDTMGMLQFGTEVVATKDGSMTGLLGASPGASTTVSIALDMLAKCFPDQMQGWHNDLVRMVPSYEYHEEGLSKGSQGKMEVHEKYLRQMARTARILNIK